MGKSFFPRNRAIGLNFTRLPDLDGQIPAPKNPNSPFFCPIFSGRGILKIVSREGECFAF
jgi:hypothetical protein